MRPATATWDGSSSKHSLETLKEPKRTTSGATKVSGGVADVGVSAFGVMTIAISVTFLTLFRLLDLQRASSVDRCPPLSRQARAGTTSRTA